MVVTTAMSKIPKRSELKSKDTFPLIRMPKWLETPPMKQDQTSKQRSFPSGQTEGGTHIAGARQRNDNLTD